MRNMIIGGVALIGLALGSTVAQAAIVDQGNTTLDTGTGLEWLDLTFSLGRTFTDVSANFGMGGDFEGYRYASETEVETFWTNAGIPDIGSSSTANADPILDLFQLIGTTQIFGSSVTASLALTSFEQSPGQRRVSVLSHNPRNNEGSATLFSFDTDESDASPVTGSYLVRNSIAPVPLPAGLPLLLAGLGGLAVLRNPKSA